MEMNCNTFIRDWNCYTDTQLIRGKLWLQFWTLKSSASHACREITFLRNFLKRMFSHFAATVPGWHGSGCNWPR